MSKATIQNGKWTRNIPKRWKQGSAWRTDMFKSVLNDARLKEALFLCEEGPSIVISAEELRRVLPKGPDHYDGKIWGPFCIDPSASTVGDQQAVMNVIHA